MIININNLVESTVIENKKEAENFLKSLKSVYKLAKAENISTEKPLLIHCRQGLQRTAAATVLITLLDEMVKNHAITELSDYKLKEKIWEYSKILADKPKFGNDMSDRMMTPQLFYSFTTPYFLEALKEAALELRSSPAPL